MRSSVWLHKRSVFPLRTLVLYALPSLVTSVAALLMALFVPAIYGCVPALMMAAGALFLLRFPITRERYAIDNT